MLTREEAITILIDECPCERNNDDYNDICQDCRNGIIELLKQQPEQLQHSTEDCDNPFCDKCGSYSRKPEQPRREIVEISHAACTHHGTSCNSTVARCNDGTLWITGNDHPRWEKILPIPQDDRVKDGQQ